MPQIYRLRILFTVLIALLLDLSPVPALATGIAPQLSAPARLSIAQLKVTGDEFVVIQNNSGSPITDLSSYWLYAYNKTNPATSGTSSSGQQLPVGTLDSGQTIVLSDKARATCGAQIAGSLSLSFGDANGYLQILQQSTASGGLVQTPGDYVSWGTDGTMTGSIAKVPSNTSDPAAMFYRTANGWQLADVDFANTCQLNAVITIGGTTIKQPVSALSTSTVLPPATIVSLANAASDTDTPVLPTADTGLNAPMVTELLPNPSGTGNDETDEFIELYNPNTKVFDLSGFVLQTGTTTKHSYTFPADTMLPATGFRAFYSADTNLSLSNGGGTAALLDPFGNTLSQATAYTTAKDGMAWALAKGTWYWTNQPTPNAANVVSQASVTTTKNTSKSTASKSSAAKVKGASTGNKGSAAGQSFAQETSASVTPIHPWTLAVVAVLAVAYGIYEYRFDLANRFYRLKRHYASRRAGRQAA